MITLITRFFFMVAGLLGGYALSQVVDWSSSTGLQPTYVILVFIILGWSIGYVFGGIIGRELTGAWHSAEERLSDIAPTDLILGAVGLLVGLVAAWLVSQPLRLLEPTWLSIVATGALSLLSGYAGVRAALVKRRDFAAALPALGRVDERPGARLVVLDTSAVIDGRFVALRRLGFVPGDIRVPRFVLGELQTLADSADDSRRARGRRGLDTLDTLSGDDAVLVFETDYADLPGVDAKLMRLAAETDGVIITVDYNLTKVARVRGIDVLNLNEVATALKPGFLPGDALHITVVKAGKEADQGVGYLEDGTMVVVADGRGSVGKDVDVEVTSVLQTSAGRMIFSRASAGPVVAALDES